MKDVPRTKCDEIGFQHAWEDCTPPIVYPTSPPQRPDKQERCVNCGLVRIYKVTVKAEIEYAMTEFRTQTNGM